VVRFRVTEKEKMSLEKEATNLGLTVSAFLRLLIRQWGNGIKFEKKGSGAGAGTTTTQKE